MLQRLGTLVAYALDQAAAADQRARDATHPQDQLHNEEVAPPFLFRCPITGSGVRGFLIEEAPSDDPNSLDVVSCLDCGQTHLVNLRTGKTVGATRRDR